VATWEDVWEDCPRRCGWSWRIKRRLHQIRDHRSLLPEQVLRPEEAIVLEVLRTDESLQIDEILEIVETQLTSSEVFTALSSWRSRAGYAAAGEELRADDVKRQGIGNRE